VFAMSSSSTSSVVGEDALLVRDVNGQYRPARAEEVLSQARRVLSQRVRRGATMSSPPAVKDDLRVEVGALEHEVFCVLFLDAQHRIIALKQMFRGTVTQTSMYPREVVKEALGLNAAAVLLAQGPPGFEPDDTTCGDCLVPVSGRSNAEIGCRGSAIARPPSSTPNVVRVASCQRSTNRKVWPRALTPACHWSADS
jgi:DNA repair protein RadC